MSSRLHWLLVDSASAALAEQLPDGSMPPGYNGPYHDPETPVRSTGHWLITFAKAHRIAGEDRYLEASRRAAAYLLRPDLRPAGATFWHRSKPGKDRCNGLIGQAWTIEALVEAASGLGLSECRELAASVFLLHPFDERAGLWCRVETDGTVQTKDGTFNHQLWFAAAGSLLMDANPLIAQRVLRFLDYLPSNVHLYSSGLIYHNLSSLLGRLAKHPLRNPRRLLTALRRARSSQNMSSLRLHDPRYRKAIGYHAFNLYALALLRQQVPQHTFWSSGHLRKAIAYVQSHEYREGLESNPYGYPYNPAGLEVAFALHVFDVLSPTREQRVREWVDEQLRRTYDNDRHRLDRNTEDPVTLAARLYEATRLPDLEVSVPP